MPLTVSKHVTAACEGPHCSTVLSFVEDNPETLPDAVWRFITLVRFDTTRHLFCSAACLLDFMRSYKPLMSPQERQQAEEKAHAETVVERAIEGTKVA